MSTKALNPAGIKTDLKKELLKKPEALSRNWTEGHLLGTLMSLAWPVVISGVLNNIGPTIDMICVGKLGSVSVAAVGVAGMLVMLLDSLKMGLDMGTRAMIARYIGAGDHDAANHAAIQGYVVTIGFAAVVGTTGAVFASQILQIMGLSPEVVEQGAPYLRIEFIGILTLGLIRQNEGTMQSSGDTVNPMKIAIIYRIFHTLLCPCLVFGWWIFPRLETRGAAYTGIISACLGSVIGIYYLVTGKSRLQLRFSRFHPDLNVIWRVIKIGVPASVTGMQRNFGYLLLTWLVVPFGTIAVAAHTLTQRIDQFVNIGSMGLGQASGILVAQNLGANKRIRSEKSGWLGASLCTATMLVGSAILWFWGPDIIRLFNSEPNLVAVCNTFIRIQIVSYLVFGYAIALQQALNSVGDTVPIMLIVLLSIFGLQIPLAYILSRYTSMGVYGTRWAIVIGTVFMAVIYAIYFQMGRWQRKNI
jgi:putative MATE family efflux protein